MALVTIMLKLITIFESDSLRKNLKLIIFSPVCDYPFVIIPLFPLNFLGEQVKFLQPVLKRLRQRLSDKSGLSDPDDIER